MPDWHVFLEGVARAGPVRHTDAVIRGVRCAVWDGPARPGPLHATFDDVADRLGRLPRMYLEPDGSFVWRGSQGDDWQLDGQLHDGGARLQSVELKGACSEAGWDRLLGTLGWPAQAVVIQLAPEAVFLDEPEFRRLVFEALPPSPTAPRRQAEKR